MSILENFFSLESLNHCVERLINNHFDVIKKQSFISTGSDRVDFAQFRRDQKMHLETIQKKVLEGRYTFSPQLERKIPKSNPKEYRTISVMTIRDTIVQRALYEYLYSSVDSTLSSSVFGYRKKTSSHNAVYAIREHFNQGMTYVFDADIKSFFDTVDHDILLAKVGKMDIDNRVNKLVLRFLKTGKISSKQVEEHKLNKGKQKKYQPTKREIGVPQGGVLSGLLSNLYLSEFDATILRRFPGLVRYADDFVVCCRSETECEQVHQLVRKTLGSLNIILHPKKTQECVIAEKGIDFVGFRISTQGIKIKGQNVSRFKNKISRVLRRQKLFSNPKRTLKSICKRLTFKIKGPSEEQLKLLAERGIDSSMCMRSWIGFFRIIDDENQINAIDRWIRKQISRFMWAKYKLRVKYTTMQEYGLPSLINSMWRARSRKSAKIELENQ